jgi:hypothetical protein
MPRGLGRAVTDAEVQTLKAGASRVDKLAPDAPEIEWFRLRTGDLLAVLGSAGGRLYTPDEFSQMQQAKEKRAADYSEHYLWGRELPSDFATRVPELLVAGEKWLEGQGVRRSPGIEGLAAVDELCDRVGRAKCAGPEMFPMLVAMVGEAMRAQVGGRWEMRRELDKRQREFFEAWVVNGAGWQAHASWVVCEALERPAPLDFAADLAVREGSLKKKLKTRRQIFKPGH